MANRTLTADELKEANTVLEELRGRLKTLAGSDPGLLFAYGRWKIARSFNTTSVANQEHAGF